MSELKRCPFCGRNPKVLQRPDSMDGYFCAVSCFCGWYSARAHQGATDKDSADEAYKKAAERWNRRTPDMGNPVTENKPLSIDELRGMDGEPVWVMFHDGSGARWGIVSVSSLGVCAVVTGDTAYWFTDICKTIAYSRKPEAKEEAE